MDKIKTLFLLMLVSIMGVISANAQSRISSVYGVDLGDSESTVSSKISGIWKTNSKGQRYYMVTNPTLGSCTFQQVTFWFTSGKLNQVSFTSAEAGTMDPNFQGIGPNGYEQFLAKSERFQKMYRTMYSDLAGKYGSPDIEDGERAVWKSNGNVIELKYKFDDDITQFGWHDGCTSILVRYYVANESSTNF